MHKVERFHKQLYSPDPLQQKIDKTLNPFFPRSVNMDDMIKALKHAYWSKRENYTHWRRHNRFDDLRRRTALRWRAWRYPIVDIDGIRLYRGSGNDVYGSASRFTRPW